MPFKYVCTLKDLHIYLEAFVELPIFQENKMCPI